MLVSSVLPPVIFSKCFWVFHSFSSPTGSIVTFLWLHWLQVFKGCFLPEVLIFNGVQPTYPQGGLQALTDGIYFHVIEKKNFKNQNHPCEMIALSYGKCFHIFVNALLMCCACIHCCLSALWIQLFSVNYHFMLSVLQSKFKYPLL